MAQSALRCSAADLSRPASGSLADEARYPTAAEVRRGFRQPITKRAAGLGASSSRVEGRSSDGRESRREAMAREAPPSRGWEWPAGLGWRGLGGKGGDGDGMRLGGLDARYHGMVRVM
ncbi:hypothetical protein CDD80_1721 [Ophiocordyceps camponoti-rufipedis]|uniref:Uncharacterized protein n=1 Tax=Ophiocordyceps camponoti-rufipedis TaxID=2004952 RepID=A0A2C5XXG0_9HYPO|nr:hypothetical protein CDD80_1721 [Ophiocordyceps camponoti-rufipedis]